MIILLHGDNIEASRNEFNRLRETKKEIRELDGKSVDQTVLTQALESSSLFGGGTIVFISNLFSKIAKKTKLITSLAKILAAAESDVVLWEEKELSAATIKNLGKAEIKLFKLPKLLFEFLDAIGHDALPLYEKVIQTEPPELVFYMITTRVRQLIQIKDGVAPEGMHGWQISRLTRQTNRVTIDRLRSMYKKLLDMEFSLKNGSSPFTIVQLTEQFLIDL